MCAVNSVSYKFVSGIPGTRRHRITENRVIANTELRVGVVGASFVRAALPRRRGSLWCCRHIDRGDRVSILSSPLDQSGPPTEELNVVIFFSGFLVSQVRRFWTLTLAIRLRCGRLGNLEDRAAPQLDQPSQVALIPRSIGTVPDQGCENTDSSIELRERKIS